jgi:chemotaxis protein MotB
MARQSRRQNEENHERWLISYADFITLLFALFVVLYAMSKVDEAKYKVFGSSLNFAFGSSILLGKPSVIDQAQTVQSEQELLLKALVDKRNARLIEQQRKYNEAMQTLVKNLNQVMAPLVKSEQVNVTQTPRGVVIDINASALFEPGEAALQRGAARTLGAVAQVLESGTEAIEVEGHTDDIPIFTPVFPSNWELSSARASSVVRLFIDQGVQAQRLRAVGLASYQPISSNETPEGRSRNRRVSVIILAPPIEVPVQYNSEEKAEIPPKAELTPKVKSSI